MRYNQPLLELCSMGKQCGLKAMGRLQGGLGGRRRWERNLDRGRKESEERYGVTQVWPFQKRATTGHASGVCCTQDRKTYRCHPRDPLMAWNVLSWAWSSGTENVNRPLRKKSSAGFPISKVKEKSWGSKELKGILEELRNKLNFGD